MTCPICLDNALSEERINDSMSVFCACCGSFRIFGTAFALLRANWPKDDRRRAALAAYIRQSNRLGIERVDLLDFESLARLAEGHLHTSLRTKLRRVLERYEEISPIPGRYVELDTAHDYPLFDAASVEELEYLILTLDQEGLLEFQPMPKGYRITRAGWEELEPVAGGVPNAAFVAMSFDKDLKPAFVDGIRRAIVEAGFEDVREDFVEHADNINDRILADIRRAQFVVADFTNHRAGVYFEAGFALGLGKPVIWTCHVRDFQIDKVHFDTRPYNHIVWETIDELRTKLSDRIAAIIPSARIP